MIAKSLRPSHHVHRALERLAALSARAVVALSLAALFGFAFVFFALSTWGEGVHGIPALAAIGNPWMRFANAVYFSAVNATTLGYGDFIPSGFSKILSVTEAAFGFFIFAVLVSKLVSEKQEIALYNVHKLAFHNAFFKTHEGFFLVRRDCDAIEAYLREHKALNEKSWSNLVIACQKGQTLIEGVLDFYDDFDWFNLDARRENLLLESFHRTLQRFSSLLQSLQKGNIDWKSQAETAMELRAFVRLSGEVTEKWKSLSTHGHAEWFSKMKGELQRLGEITR